MSPDEPPEALRRVVARWRARGRPAQPGIEWPREVWGAAFPDYADLLSRLPDNPSRHDISSIAAQADASTDDAVNAFLASMIWGYGRSGYARSRAREALESNDAGPVLHGAAQVLIECGPVAAYAHLAQHRLQYFGPAFGTKYLYFCGRDRVDENALMLDTNLAEWLTRHSDLRLNPVPWSKRTYEAYLATLGGWASALDVTPEDVESCIFRDAVAGAGGQWDEQL